MMRRPWNLIDVPVYSLITEDQCGNINMNICTYVSVSSLKPKTYCIALNKTTKTYSNLSNNNLVVLQLLNKKNIQLVKILGKKSANKYDKISYLKKNNFLNQISKFKVLKNINSFVILKKSKTISTDTDHDLFLFNIEKYKVFSEENILTFQDLVNNKIIL
tara:strand:+ start:41 stop:523 length:483 start_codon:yes stop_codon:yes gene_type:complete